MACPADRPFVRLAPVPSASGTAGLTDVEWEGVRPLLPPEKPETGRTNKDHRQIINGIVWKLATGVPWRDLPERYGPWQTVYKRYRLWNDTGGWQRLLALLSDAPSLRQPK